MASWYVSLSSTAFGLVHGFRRYIDAACQLQNSEPKEGIKKASERETRAYRSIEDAQGSRWDSEDVGSFAAL